jgi:hypothetical protein
VPECHSFKRGGAGGGRRATLRQDRKSAKSTIIPGDPGIRGRKQLV